MSGDWLTVTIIANVLRLHASDPDFVATAWQVVAGLEIAGFRIVPTITNGGSNVI